MDSYTQQTQQWLEDRFRRGVDEGRYFAHKPIYGYGKQPTEKNHIIRYTIALSILRVLNRFDCHTLLDLGGGEGYISTLSRDILGFDPLMVDLPHESCKRANELFGLPSRQVDVHNVPFEDNSADVVILSEVVEHLMDPVRAMSEAYRVASKAVIITTQETHPWQWEREARMKVRNLDRGHAERTFFHPRDFKALFGSQVEFRNPCLIYPLEDETRVEEKEARKLVSYLAKPLAYGPGSLGIMAIVIKDPDVWRWNRKSEGEIINKLFNFSVPLPNVSRAHEVKWPDWVKEKSLEEVIEKGKESDYLEQLFPQLDREHIDHLYRLQAQDPESRFCKKTFFRLVLAFAAFLRLIIGPGNIIKKIAWVFRIMRKNIISKIFGD